MSTLNVCYYHIYIEAPNRSDTITDVAEKQR